MSLSGIVRGMKPVTIAALERAINRAREASPATGNHAALDPEVGVLAAIYGELIFRGHKAFDLDSLTPTEQQALERWLDPAPQSTNQAA